jgi:lysozyme family protein
VTIGTLSSYLGRKATKAEVKALTVAMVEPIYKKGYWDKVNGDKLPSGVDYVAFDGAVNSGPSRGAKWVQQGAGATADGAIGPATLKAITLAGSIPVIKKACARRLGFVQGLRTFDAFGKGWTRRIVGVEAGAVKMAAVAAGTDVVGVLEIERDKAGQTATRLGQGATASGASVPASVATVDLTPFELYGLVGLAAIAIIVLMVKRNQSTQRRKAYQEALEE